MVSFPKDRVTLLVAAAVAAGGSSVWADTTAAILYDPASGHYTQNFNTLPTGYDASGNLLPGVLWQNALTAPFVDGNGASNYGLPGWYAYQTAFNPIALYANNGTVGERDNVTRVPWSTTAPPAAIGNGGLFSWAPGTPTDPVAQNNTNRALAFRSTTQSGSQSVGVEMVNNTNQVLTSFTISYTAEEWFNAGATAANAALNPLQFSYGLNAVTPTGANVSVPSLNYVAPYSGAVKVGGVSTSGYLFDPTGLNTNAQGKTDAQLFPAINGVGINVTKTATITVNWRPGQTLFLAWTEGASTSKLPGVAIDNVDFTAGGGTAYSLDVWDPQNNTGTSPNSNWNYAETNFSDGTTHVLQATGATHYVQFGDGPFANPNAGTPTAPGTVYVGNSGASVSPGSVDITNTSGTYTFVAAAPGIGISGAGTITKTNAGTVVMDHSIVNTFTGGLNIYGGTLRVSNDGNLGATGGPINLDSAVLQYDQLHDANGNRINFADGSARSVGLGSNFGTIVVSDAADTVLLGSLTNPQVFTKDGPGKLILGTATTSGLSGPGVLHVNAGTLELRGIPVGNGPIIPFSNAGGTMNGTLILDSSDPADVAPGTRVTIAGGLLSGTGQILMPHSGLGLLAALAPFEADGVTPFPSIVGVPVHVNQGGTLAHSYNPSVMAVGDGNFRVFLGASNVNQLVMNSPVDGPTDLFFQNNFNYGGGGPFLLNAQNTYTGNTFIVNSGTITMGIDNVFPHTTLVFGTTTDALFGQFIVPTPDPISGLPVILGKPGSGGAGALDLHGHNQTVAYLSTDLTVTYNKAFQFQGDGVTPVSDGHGGTAITLATVTDNALGIQNLATDVTGHKTILSTFTIDGKAAGNSTYNQTIGPSVEDIKLVYDGGTNTLALSNNVAVTKAASKYFGGTEFRSGTVTVDSDATLGAVADPIYGTSPLIFSGGTLQPLSSQAAGTFNSVRALTVTDGGAGAGGGVLDTNGNIVTLGGTANTSFGNATHAFQISDSAGGGALSFNRTGGTVTVAAGATLQINPGATVNVSGADSFTDNSGTATNGNHVNIVNNSIASLHVTGGSIGAGTISGAGNTTVSDGASLTATGIVQNTLSIGTTNGAMAAIRPTATPNTTSATSVVSTLTIAGGSGAWAGQLDLGNNSMVIHGGDLGQIADQIKQGMGLTTVVDPGHNGITSSTALSTTATPNQDTTLGYALASQVSSGSFSFEGQSVNGTDVLIKYTWKADANLDGIVNVTDLGVLAGNYGKTAGMSWATGDFNDDGIVNVTDLGLLAGFYGRGVTQGSPLMSFSDAMALFPQFGGSGSVPEPTSLGLLGLGAVGLLTRRRRNK